MVPQFNIVVEVRGHTSIHMGGDAQAHNSAIPFGLEAIHGKWSGRGSDEPCSDFAIYVSVLMDPLSLHLAPPLYILTLVCTAQAEAQPDAQPEVEPEIEPPSDPEVEPEIEVDAEAEAHPDAGAAPPPAAGPPAEAEPSPADVKVFLKTLKDSGVNAMHRKSKGADIDAGCGQLRIAGW